MPQPMPHHSLILALHERRPDIESAAARHICASVREYRAGLVMPTEGSMVLDLSLSAGTIPVFDPCISVLWGEFDQMVAWITDDLAAVHQIASENGSATQDIIMAAIPPELTPEEEVALRLVTVPGSRCRPFVVTCLKLGDHWLACGRPGLLAQVRACIRSLAVATGVDAVALESRSWPEIVLIATARGEDLEPLARFLNEVEAMKVGQLEDPVRAEQAARDVANLWVGSPKQLGAVHPVVAERHLVVHSRHQWGIAGQDGAPSRVLALLRGEEPGVPATPPVPPTHIEKGRAWIDARLWIRPRHGHADVVVDSLGTRPLRFAFDGTSHAVAFSLRMPCTRTEMLALADYACGLRTLLAHDVFDISTTLSFKLDDEFKRLWRRKRKTSRANAGFAVLNRIPRDEKAEAFEYARFRRHRMGVTEAVVLRDLVTSVRDCVRSPTMFGTMAAVHSIVELLMEQLYEPLPDGDEPAPNEGSDRRLLLHELQEAYQQRLQHSAMFLGGARLHEAVPPGVARISGWMEALVASVFDVARLADKAHQSLFRFGVTDDLRVGAVGRVNVVNMGIAFALQPATWGMMFHELGHILFRAAEQEVRAAIHDLMLEPEDELHWTKVFGEFAADCCWRHLGCEGDAEEFAHSLFRAAAMFPAEGRRSHAEIEAHVAMTISRAQMQMQVERRLGPSAFRALVHLYFPESKPIDDRRVGGIRATLIGVDQHVSSVAAALGQSSDSAAHRMRKARALIRAAGQPYRDRQATTSVVRDDTFEFQGPCTPGWYLDSRGRTFLMGSDARRAFMEVQESAFTELDAILQEQRAETFSGRFSERRRHPRREIPEPGLPVGVPGGTARLKNWGVGGLTLDPGSWGAGPCPTHVEGVKVEPIEASPGSFRYAERFVHPEGLPWRR